jgi:hypothetical protein
LYSLCLKKNQVRLYLPDLDKSKKIVYMQMMFDGYIFEWLNS